MNKAYRRQTLKRVKVRKARANDLSVKLTLWNSLRELTALRPHDESMNH